jgi:hypothetical protein
VSGEDNKGDGIVVCGQDPQAAIKERGWNTTVYKVRRCQKGADAVLGAAWVLDITLLAVVDEAGLLQGCVKDAHSAGWQPSERLWHFTMCRVCRSFIIIKINIIIYCIICSTGEPGRPYKATQGGLNSTPHHVADVCCFYAGPWCNYHQAAGHFDTGRYTGKCRTLLRLQRIVLSYHISKWLWGLKRECAPAVALGADSAADS